jgi:hypothetical protein
VLPEMPAHLDIKTYCMYSEKIDDPGKEPLLKFVFETLQHSAQFIKLRMNCVICLWKLMQLRLKDFSELLVFMIL